MLGSALLLWMCTGMAEDSTNAPASLVRSEASPATSEAPESASTNWNGGLTFGAGFGVAALGSTDAHDLAIATLHVGKLLESEKPLGPRFRAVEWGAGPLPVRQTTWLNSEIVPQDRLEAAANLAAIFGPEPFTPVAEATGLGTEQVE